jgi:hypothetical protein
MHHDAYYFGWCVNRLFYFNCIPYACHSNTSSFDVGCARLAKSEERVPDQEERKCSIPIGSIKEGCC